MVPKETSCAAPVGLAALLTRSSSASEKLLIHEDAIVVVLVLAWFVGDAARAS